MEVAADLLGGDKDRRTGKKGIIDGLKELRAMLQPRSRITLISDTLEKISKPSREAAPAKIADLERQLEKLFAVLQKDEDALFSQQDASSLGVLPQMAKAAGFVLHFAIDALGRAEQTFSDLADVSEDDAHLLDGLVSVSPKDLLHGLKDRSKQAAQDALGQVRLDAKLVAEKLQKEVNDAVQMAAGSIRSVLKELKVLAGDPDGWGVTIADMWTNMADDATAFGIIREGLQTYFGPGSRPELVEESALHVCLELQPFLLQLLQEGANADPGAVPERKQDKEQRKLDIAQRAQSIGDLHSALHLIVEATSAEIFSSRTTSPHANVQRLFYVAEHRPLVQYTVQSSWQALGDAVIESHANALAEENALQITFDKYLGTLGDRITDVDQVAATKSNKNAVEHCQLKVLKNADRIDATMTAVKEDLGSGHSGVAGLVTSALLKLTEINYQIDKVHEQVRAA